MGIERKTVGTVRGGEDRSEKGWMLVWKLQSSKSCTVCVCVCVFWFSLWDFVGGLVMVETFETEWWRALTSTGGIRLLLQTFSLVFVAEWGDKSMLATIALAAAKSPVGVVVGGVAGHFIATVVAVLGGSLLGKYISEKTARLVGGVLFFVFAILTLFKVY